MRATQAGYLPPALVRDGAERFGWWPFHGQPRTESDVYRSIVLREMATRERWLAKRSGRYRTTRLGLRLLADPVERWRAVASAVGRPDPFSSALGELAAHRLLEGPAERALLGQADELVDAVAPVVLAQGWRHGSRPLELEDVRRAIHEPLIEWRLFGLLDEEEPRWVDGHPEGRWVTSLTDLGRATVLAHLQARATEPRRDLMG